MRDKLTWLIGYAETVRALTHVAADRCRVDEATGIAYPDPLTTNLAKWTFARDYQQAVEHIIDVAAGLLVTGPGDADWASRALCRRRDLGRLRSCGQELLEQGVVSLDGHEVEAPVDEQVVEAVDAGLDDDVWLLG